MATTDTANWKRNAGFFVGGQALSMFGSMLVQYAVTWYITMETQSGAWMTLFTCAGLLPMVIISPLAGVWADRYNRKYLINISDGAIALVTLLLAVLFLMGNENMLLMLVVVAVRGFGQGIQSPAASALTPQLVPTEHLMRFNGIQSMAHSITMFASPMLAGALLTVMPIKYIFFIDVVTAAIGIAVVFFCVHVPPLERTKTANGIRAYFDDLKTGLRYIAHTTWLKILFGYLAFFCVSMTPASMLTPLQVSRTFGNDVWRLTAIEVLFSLGMVLGGVAVSAWGGFRNRVHTVILACLVFGATMVLFGVISNFAIYLTVMVLCGVTVPFFNTPIATVLQTKIDPQIMGRIFSLVMMVNSLATPIGMLLFGPLSDVVKIEYLLIATGTLVFLSSFVLRMSKDLEAAGEPMPTPAVT